MFELAFLIGIYAYLIFFLGLLGSLRSDIILLTTIVFLFGAYWYIRKKVTFDWLSIKTIYTRDKMLIAGISMFICLVIVNLIGALGPELAFDALWYHLTFPKLYLLSEGIHYIPGSLLYYSVMPKLIEMLYVPALLWGGEAAAKLIQLLLGALVSIIIYKISRNYAGKRNALMAVLLFYGSFVVAWQSITAYIDLGRTFFEIMALYGFSLFLKTKKRVWLMDSAFLLGLAICTKLLSAGSLVIFIILLLIRQRTQEDRLYIIIYIALALLVPLPWFIFSWTHTGNPVFPFFTSLYPMGTTWSLLSPLNFVQEVINMFMNLPDKINPLYLLIFLLAPFLYKKCKSDEKTIFWYALIAIIIWYITPRTGGGRFILPYLPAFSIVGAIVLEKLNATKGQRILYVLIFLMCVVTIGYRSIANAKYVPVILGIQTKDEFLTQNLNFNFGDFYDTDSYFRTHIKNTDTVLLYGFHNLYYVKFPFIDSTWVKKGETFNYIATQDAQLPERFSYWKLIYQNDKTHVKLYSLGGQKWVY